MTDNINDAKYIKISMAQEKKHGHFVCGDFFMSSREKGYTYAVLCDGIGSGTHANISAVMCAERIKELMRAHLDLKTIGHKVASFMKNARTQDNFPFAAFCALSFSPDGRYRAVTYENPLPLLAEHTTVSEIEHLYSTDSGEVVGMCSGRLDAGDTLFVMSDGVTQAGLGVLGGMGWGSRGFLRLANDMFQQKRSVEDLLDKTVDEACKLSGGIHKDDVTIAAFSARNARTLNILTGPPSNKEDDKRYVEDFLSNEGKKVICGSTTAEIFSRISNKEIEAKEVSVSFASPPMYEIEGIDLVSEGSATLTQAINILDISIKEYLELNAVTELCILLKEADIVNIFLGCAKNSANQGLAFKQLGIFPRQTAVSLLAQKLKSAGIQTNIFKY